MIFTGKKTKFLKKIRSEIAIVRRKLALTKSKKKPGKKPGRMTGKLEKKAVKKELPNEETEKPKVIKDKQEGDEEEESQGQKDAGM